MFNFVLKNYWNFTSMTYICPPFMFETAVVVTLKTFVINQKVQKWETWVFQATFNPIF